MSRETAVSGAYEDVEHDQPLLAGMDESNVRRREEGERLYTSSRRVCARYAHPAPPTVYIAHGGQGAPRMRGASHAACTAGMMGLFYCVSPRGAMCISRHA